MIEVAGKKKSPRTIKYFGYNNGSEFIAKGSLISSKLIMGAGSRINGKIVIKGRGAVEIGCYCAVGDGVRVVTQNHSIDEEILSLALQRSVYGNIKVEAADVKIGNNVWVGDSAIILPGVSVGSGAVIGAGSIVTKNVAPFDVVAGNPARKIKNRHRENFFIDDALWESSAEKLVSFCKNRGGND